MKQIQCRKCNKIINPLLILLGDQYCGKCHKTIMLRAIAAGHINIKERL